MKEKNNSRLVWLVVILVIIILGLVGFIVYDKFLYEEKDKTTTLIQNNIEEENILRRDNFVYNLNDIDYQISYLYKKMDSKEFELWKKNSNSIEIKNNNEIHNMIYLEILLNEKKVNVEIPLSYNYENTSNEDLLKIIQVLSSDTINTLKGSNSEYLFFTIQHASPYFVDGGINPFIVNKSGEVIDIIEFKDNTAWWTTDKNSIMYDKGEYYLTTDTLYYLMPNCEQTNDNGLYFDQYSLKIENDKTVVEKQETHKGEAAGGAVCGG